MNKSKNITIKQGFIMAIIIYFMLAAILYFIGDEELKYRSISSEIPSQEAPIGEITDEIVLQQSFRAETNIIDGVTLALGTYARKNEGELIVRVLDKEKHILTESKIETANLVDNEMFMVEFGKEITGLMGEELNLQITSTVDSDNNAVTIYYNSQVSDADKILMLNDKKIEGTLCFSIKGKQPNLFGTYYWYFVLLGAVIITLYCISIVFEKKRGKENFFIHFYHIYCKYRFLIKQLVMRDFKTKYKRSVLGVLWSFLNPLLTMFIQYLVFSTIFKANITNFPVYLLTGSVLFSFFTESVGLGLNSIVGNASLITKVYVPKYIYPLTRVLSTAITLVISLCPLFITILITGEQVTKAYLLLPFVLICTIIFCMGMSFFLSSTMVFFRDTQFLWGVVSLLWMYATPLFYPENIIPEKYSFILKVNPMYYFIKFARIVVLEGISPQPIQYLQCLACACITFAIGAAFFKKVQDKFILYI